MSLYDFRFVRPLNQGARDKVSFHIMKGHKSLWYFFTVYSSECVVPESRTWKVGLCQPNGKDITMCVCMVYGSMHVIVKGSRLLPPPMPPLCGRPLCVWVVPLTRRAPSGVGMVIEAQVVSQVSTSFPTLAKGSNSGRVGPSDPCGD